MRPPFSRRHPLGSTRKTPLQRSGDLPRSAGSRTPVVLHRRFTYPCVVRDGGGCTPRGSRAFGTKATGIRTSVRERCNHPAWAFKARVMFPGTVFTERSVGGGSSFIVSIREMDQIPLRAVLLRVDGSGRHEPSSVSRRTRDGREWLVLQVPESDRCPSFWRSTSEPSVVDSLPFKEL